MAELIDHPCVQHKLALIRDVETGHKRFRELATEITKFICYEALKNIQTKEVLVQTPVAEAKCRKLDTDLVVVPILRAGVGMLEGILELVPTARVGFVGLYRDEGTKLPVTYYERFPQQIKGGTCIIIDPMLATGGSTAAAIDKLKESGACLDQNVFGGTQRQRALLKRRSCGSIEPTRVDRRRNYRSVIGFLKPRDTERGV